MDSVLARFFVTEEQQEEEYRILGVRIIIIIRQPLTIDAISIKFVTDNVSRSIS